MLSKIDDPVYRSLEGVSQSTVVQSLLHSPAEFYRRQKEPFEPTPKMLLGTLIHAMVLEPDTIESRFVRIPKIDKRKAEHKALLSSLTDEQRILIDSESWDLAEQVVIGMGETKAANQLFSGGESEVAVHGHTFNDLLVKGKLDYLHKSAGVIVDLKTTELDLSDDSLKWVLDQKHYKIQAAFYVDLMKAETNSDEWTFCFFFAQVKPPFEMRKVICSDLLNGDWLNEGREFYLEGLRRIKSWQETNSYPKLIEIDSFIPKSKPWRIKQ